MHVADSSISTPVIECILLYIYLIHTGNFDHTQGVFVCKIHTHKRFKRTLFIRTIILCVSILFRTLAVILVSNFVLFVSLFAGVPQLNH